MSTMPNEPARSEPASPPTATPSLRTLVVERFMRASAETSEHLSSLGISVWSAAFKLSIDTRALSSRNTSDLQTEFAEELAELAGVAAALVSFRGSGCGTSDYWEIEALTRNLDHGAAVMQSLNPRLAVAALPQRLAETVHWLDDEMDSIAFQLMMCLGLLTAYTERQATPSEVAN